MRSDLLDFFSLQRQIFGICPKCGDFFRLSDCNIYLKKKPTPDWMDKIDGERNRLIKIEERLDEKEEELREKAREKGRQLAQRTVKKIDKIFPLVGLIPTTPKLFFTPSITSYLTE